jgi:hypothetical protein
MWPLVSNPCFLLPCLVCGMMWYNPGSLFLSIRRRWNSGLICHCVWDVYFSKLKLKLVFLAPARQSSCQVEIFRHVAGFNYWQSFLGLDSSIVTLTGRVGGPFSFLSHVELSWTSTHVCVLCNSRLNWCVLKYIALSSNPSGGTFFFPVFAYSM